MFAKTDAVLQGTIELLVLKRLSRGPMHGYGIASWIETATDDVLRVEKNNPSTRPSTGWRRRGGSRAQMGHVGQQPARQVLPADDGRPA